jgi:hypothetical protein
MDNIPDEFKCPITLDLMNDPVLCEDGFTYERSAIMSTRDSLSPMTRQPIDKTKLIPNRALINAIDRFISSNSQVKDYLLEKEKQEKKKAELEMKHKIEKERIEKEKRDLEENSKINQLRKLKEERILQTKCKKEMRIKQKEMRIKLEQEHQQERIRIEQEHLQERIRIEQEYPERIRIEQIKRRIKILGIIS